MLSVKMKSKIRSIFSMRIIAYLLTLIFIVLGSYGCSALDLIGFNKADREKLDTRVQGFYYNWIEKNNDECSDYLLPGIFDVKKMEEMLNNINLVNYSVNGIKVMGKKAKVSMHVEVLMDDDKKFIQYYDYWEYINNNWYIYDCWRIQ